MIRGAAKAELLAALQRVAVMPAATLGLLGGGTVAFAMTRRALPGAIRDGALRPIGWSAARRSHVALAACLGVVLAALYVFVLARLFSPAPGQTVGPLA